MEGRRWLDDLDHGVWLPGRRTDTLLDLRKNGEGVMVQLPSRTLRPAGVLRLLLMFALLGTAITACEEEQPAVSPRHNRTGRTPPTNGTSSPVVDCSGDAEACLQEANRFDTAQGVPRDAARAVKVLTQVCTGGHQEACRRLGALFRDGRVALLLGQASAPGISIPRDVSQAAQLFQKACDSGNQTACADLGGLHIDGLGVHKDPVHAVQLFRAACDASVGVGCLRLGNSYGSGAGVEKNHETAESFYEKACKLKNALGCFFLAQAREKAGATFDYSEAANLFKDECSAADGEACDFLGVLYEKGKGVSAAPSLAAKSYMDGCIYGSATSCHDIATYYRLGEAVAKDISSAVKYYELACGGGSGNACAQLGSMYAHNEVSSTGPAHMPAALYERACNLGTGWGCNNAGILYENGTGVEKDAVRAATFYRKGCDLGESIGCTYLADAYRLGTGVTKDLSRALTLLTEACKYFIGACDRLGSMYDNGEGVPRDAIKATALFDQACKAPREQGWQDTQHADACSRFARLSATPPPPPIESAKCPAGWTNLNKGLCYKLEKIWFPNPALASVDITLWSPVNFMNIEGRVLIFEDGEQRCGGDVILQNAVAKRQAPFHLPCGLDSLVQDQSRLRVVFVVKSAY